MQIKHRAQLGQQKPRNIYNRGFPRAVVTLVTGRPRSQAVDGEVAQRPGQEATPRLEQGGPRWHRQELVPQRRQSHWQEVPETERGEWPSAPCTPPGSPQCLCWPRRGWEMAQACGPSCREQRRAGKGRTQAQLQSGVTGLSGRGQTQEEEGCQWGSRQSPSGSQQQQKPQFGAGRDALGCKGQGSDPEVGSRQWSQNPWAVPALTILPAPGFRLQEWWAGPPLFRPPAAGGAADPSSVPLDPLRHCSQESCRPCCFQPVSKPGRGTDAGGSRVHFNR